jgi:recombinational DNA repair ATPase RecF
MKITKVEIENFRCFERLAVSLEEDITAIIGVNAAGKTALLDAIALAISPLLDGTDLRISAGSLLPSHSRAALGGIALKHSDLRIAERPEKPAAQGQTPSTLALTVNAQAVESIAEVESTPLSWRHTMSGGALGLALGGGLS